MLKNFKTTNFYLISEKYFKIIQSCIEKFITDRGPTKAAALTYYSLLAVVPFLATLFGVSKGFGLDQILEETIQTRFAEHRQFVEQMIEFSIQTLENTKGGWLAGIGALILFWTLIKVFSHLERIINQIWMINKLRPTIKRYSDYLSLILLCPFLLIATSSFNLFIAKQSFQLASDYFLPAIPFIIVSTLFTLLYIFLPNCKVQIQPALISGFITGFIFQLLQKTYLFSQIYVSNLGAIYGSFAALPLFIVWLNVSWTFFIFGAELSYMIQNFEMYHFSIKSPAFNKKSIDLLSLQIIKLLADSLNNGTTSSLSYLAKNLDAPLELVKSTISSLENINLLHKVIPSQDTSEPFYALSFAPNQRTISDILTTIYNHGRSLPASSNQAFSIVNESLENLQQELRHSPNNQLISNL